MALTPEDLEALSAFMDKKLEAHTGAQSAKTAEQAKADATKDYTRLAGVPLVDPEAGPDYYIHLANGDVIESKDAGATHMDVDGETVAVIGRWQKNAKPPVDETLAPTTNENTPGVGTSVSPVHPQTGPAPRFDPQTGPAPRFDPQTGQPITGEVNR